MRPIPFLAAFLLALACLSPPAVGADRAWTLRDSIAVRYVIGAGESRWSAEPAAPFVWSPQRDHFFFVTRRGRLDCDCNEYELIVFAVASVDRALSGPPQRAALAPLRRIVRLSRGERLGVSEPHWAEHGPPAILFRSPDAAGQLQVFRLDVASGRIDQLTRVETGVLWPYAVGGDSVVYTIVSGETETRGMDDYPAGFVDEHVLANVLLGRRTIGRFSMEVTGAPRPRRLFEVVRNGFAGAWMSPDGQVAIVRATQGLNGEAIMSADPFDPMQLPREPAAYVLVETATGNARPLRSAEGAVVDQAPSSAPVISWSADRSRVVISGRGRAPGTSAVSCAIATALCDPVAAPVPRQQVAGAPFMLALEESANDPQNPVARRGGARVSLLEPDQALAGIRRAVSREVRWTEPDGREVSGQLYLPARSATGAPPPLVIQAYHSLPRLFRPDGPLPTAYAAQGLAAQGMAVLQLDIPSLDRPEVTGDPREGRAFVDRVDAAVASLAGAGLVDPDRVGLVGFSRGGFMVYHALTHPGRTRISAALIADSYTSDYGWRMLVTGTGMSPEWAVRIDRQNGGGSPWQAPEAWRANSPGFNAQRIQSPMLYVLATAGLQPAFLATEMIGNFRGNRRPLDVINLPGGVHVLTQPLQRLAAMEGNVDWMNFWLQGRESSDPAKAEQNRRWRRLRADWERQQAWEAAGNPAGTTPSPDFPEAAQPDRRPR